MVILAIWLCCNYLFRVIIILRLSLGKPSQECLCGLADLLASRKVNVLLAGSGAPFGDNLLGDKIIVVVKHEDLRDQVVDFWVLLAAHADEALGTSEESLLVAFRGDQLCQLVDIHIIAVRSLVHTFFSSPALLGIWATMLSSNKV